MPSTASSFAADQKPTEEDLSASYFWGFSVEIRANFTQYTERAILQGADQCHCPESSRSINRQAQLDSNLNEFHIV
jgi:hypothetical protein